MSRLIRLAILGLAGYGILELVRRWRFEEGPARRPMPQRDRLMEQATSGKQGSMGTLTGGGRGMIQTTQDATGTSSPHVVGRGVVPL